MEGGNDAIRVYTRVRPCTDASKAACASLSLGADSQSISLAGQSFTFDHVAGADATQEDVFNAVGLPISKSCLEGINGCIFAYGQTGSGKTHTIYGPTDSTDGSQKGLLPRILDYVFDAMATAEGAAAESVGINYSCRISFLEIYNERVFDLLAPPPRNGAAASSLQVRENTSRGVFVEELTEQAASSATEAHELLAKGQRGRHVAATAMNRESSRSHSVFTLVVESSERRGGVVRSRLANFHLIDLAGSERQKLTGATGDRLKEAGKINQSLSALGNVIAALVDIAGGKQRHVHYRDSKLTTLLRDSLGGNSRTALIANLSPAEESFAETLSTLKFAARAKLVKNRAVVNEDTTGSLSQLQALVKTQKAELARCYAALGALEDGTAAAASSSDGHAASSSSSSSSAAASAAAAPSTHHSLVRSSAADDVAAHLADSALAHWDAVLTEVIQSGQVGVREAPAQGAAASANEDGGPSRKRRRSARSSNSGASAASSSAASSSSSASSSHMSVEDFVSALSAFSKEAEPGAEAGAGPSQGSGGTVTAATAATALAVAYKQLTSVVGGPGAAPRLGASLPVSLTLAAATGERIASLETLLADALSRAVHAEAAAAESEAQHADALRIMAGAEKELASAHMIVKFRDDRIERLLKAAEAGSGGGPAGSAPLQLMASGDTGTAADTAPSSSTGGSSSAAAPVGGASASSRVLVQPKASGLRRPSVAVGGSSSSGPTAAAAGGRSTLMAPTQSSLAQRRPSVAVGSSSAAMAALAAAASSSSTASRRPSIAPSAPGSGIPTLQQQQAAALRRSSVVSVASVGSSSGPLGAGAVSTTSALRRPSVAVGGFLPYPSSTPLPPSSEPLDLGEGTAPSDLLREIALLRGGASFHAESQRLAHEKAGLEAEVERLRLQLTAPRRDDAAAPFSESATGGAQPAPRALPLPMPSPELASFFSRLADEVSSLAQELVEARLLLAACDPSIGERARAAVAAAEARTAAAEARVAGLEVAAEDYRAAVGFKEESLGQLEEGRAHLEAKLRAVQAEAEAGATAAADEATSLLNSIAVLEAALEATTLARDGAAVQAAASATEIVSLRSTVAELEAGNAKMQGSLVAVEASNATLQGTVAALQSERDAVHASLARLQAQAEEADGVVLQLQGTCNAAQQQLAAQGLLAAEAAVGAAVEIGSLRDALSAGAAEAVSLRAQLTAEAEAAGARIGDLEAEGAALRVQLSGLSSDLECARQAGASAGAEAAAAGQREAAATERVSELTQELMARSRELADAQRSLSSSVDRDLYAAALGTAEEASAALAASQAALVEAHSQTAALVATGAAAAVALDVQGTQLAGAQARMAQLELGVAAARAEASAAASRAEAAEPAAARVPSLEAELSQLRSNHAAGEAEAARRQGELSAALAAIEGVATAAASAAAAASCEAKEQAAAALEQAALHHTAELGAAEARAAAASAEAGAAMQAVRAAAEAAASAQADAIQALTAQCTGLGHELGAVRGDLEREREAKAAREAELGALRAQLAEAQQHAATSAAANAAASAASQSEARAADCAHSASATAADTEMLLPQPTAHPQPGGGAAPLLASSRAAALSVLDGILSFAAPPAIPPTPAVLRKRKALGALQQQQRELDQGAPAAPDAAAPPAAKRACLPPSSTSVIGLADKENALEPRAFKLGAKSVSFAGPEGQTAAAESMAVLRDVHAAAACASAPLTVAAVTELRYGVVAPQSDDDTTMGAASCTPMGAASGRSEAALVLAADSLSRSPGWGGSAHGGEAAPTSSGSPAAQSHHTSAVVDVEALAAVDAELEAAPSAQEPRAVTWAERRRRAMEEAGEPLVGFFC